MSNTSMSRDKSTFYGKGIDTGLKTAQVEFAYSSKSIKSLTLAERLIAKAWIKAQDEKWRTFKTNFIYEIDSHD